MLYADVILPLPLQDTYTYAIPQEMENDVHRGCRVVVQFGQKKVYTAIVYRIHDQRPAFDTVKEISELLETHPIVNEKQIELWEWISSYYMCPLGDVYKAALPGGLKPKDENALREKRKRRNLKLAYEDWTAREDTNQKALSPAQTKAYDEIMQSFSSHATTLLHGVTSSGKTEIYIHLIQKYISEGKQVLYLLPEIALTAQITERLERVFGDSMCVYHSKHTDAQRVAIYQKQLSDEPYQLILGVRSSVFLPYNNLGLIIVDEEHEQSYKQQEPAPRYHARSAALILARQFGSKTLLGTATPSFETYHAARTNRFGYVQLTERYKGMQLPDIRVIDIKTLRHQKRMLGAFSPELVEAVREALDRHEQVILFQNRRGFSNFIECKQCGWVPRCAHCDVSLTYHKKTNQLTCHYCGYTYRLPDTCPACEEKHFINKGVGTEKIEDQIKELFPEASVLRMDLDTTRARDSYEKIINEFAEHHADILIGTQMVTKGLDFDNVSVVGILDADTMLNQPDFRAYERTFQTLSQVAGRAGRKNYAGKVFLQTRSADSSLIKQVMDNDFWGMFYEQMLQRQTFNYPPFHRLIYIYLKHRDGVLLDHMATEMAERLRKVFGERILGPDTPPVSRVQSLFIRKIMLKIEHSASPAKVRSAILAVHEQILKQPVANSLHIYYDVDPL